MSAHWARDAVLAELQRGPRTKDELQEAIGIGPTDLREAIRDLGDALEGTDDGWRLAPGTEEDGVIGPGILEPQEPEPAPLPGASAAASLEETAAEDRTEPELPAGGSVSSEGPFRARILVEVTYNVDVDAETYENPQHQAVVEARALKDAAAGGILDLDESLTVGASVLEVSVIEARRIHP